MGFNLNLYEPLTYQRGATFTVELGTLVSNGFDVGMNQYPIFDEEYRAGLNSKIIEHYWFREIGFETPQLFKRFLNRRLNEVMPYYNQLYKSTLKEFDPYNNYSLTTTGESIGDASGETTGKRTAADTSTTDATRTNSESGSTDGSTGSKSRNLVSTTPQMQLAGHEDYATNITDAVTEGTSAASTESESTAHDASTNSANSTVDDAGTSKSRTVTEYTTKVAGITGITSSRALQEFRETFINIDMMVIDELADLFMGIYTDYMNVL